MGSFYFSSRTWHEVSEKVDTSTLRTMFNTHLRLANYTEKVKEIFFIYIVTLPRIMHITPEKKRFSRSEKCLEICLAMDYETFKNAEISECKEMMANLYLESIKTYKSIWGMKKIAFNTDLFYEDVRKLLEKEGWLKKD